MKEILWFALLMSPCCLGLSGAEGLERIETCDTRCPEGLCKKKQDFVFMPPCQTPAESLNTSSVIRNVGVSTVMRCEGRQKCVLHLRVQTQLQLTEPVHGVTICTTIAGLLTACQSIGFKRGMRETMSGQQVEVGSDCTEVSPSQQVKVTVKTVPNYCGVAWTGSYETPGCSSEDLRKHVPECITGRLSYDLIPGKQELSVGVSDMLEDYDYLVRLCHRDFICRSTGVNAVIKKEEPLKRVTLPYPRPVPCLCIEGWSAVSDAPRVQTCPFKERLEELWSGITFDPLEEALSWTPACPVTAEAALCQKSESEACVDVPQSSRSVGRGKITFARVDPHPQLCVKFTAEARSWIRCPFTDARYQAWSVEVTGEPEHQEVTMSSQITADFSVALCRKSEGSTVCDNTTQTVHMEKQKAVTVELQGEVCGSCLQVRRLGVAFAATVVHCFEDCEAPHVSPVASGPAPADWTWVLVPAGVCLSVVIMITLVLHVLLTVYQRRKRKLNGSCRSKKQTDLAFDCAVPALQIQPSGVLVPDTEKANLISD